MNQRTLIRIRFIGGPLDGQEHASETAPPAYRLPHGEYHLCTVDDACSAAVFQWQSDLPTRWYDGVAEPPARRI